MHESSTIRYLRGRFLKGYNAPIVAIYTRANDRVVVYADGHRQVMSKNSLRKQVHDSLTLEQKAAMQKTIHKLPDGNYSVQIGGIERGETKQYKTEAAAKAALTRHYGK